MVASCLLLPLVHGGQSTARLPPPHLTPCRIQGDSLLQFQRNAHHRATGHAVPSSWNTLSPSPQPSDLGPIHISAEELLWKQIPIHRFGEHQGSPPPSICHNAILFIFKFTSPIRLSHGRCSKYREWEPVAGARSSRALQESGFLPFPGGQ